MDVIASSRIIAQHARGAPGSSKLDQCTLASVGDTCLVSLLDTQMTVLVNINRKLTKFSPGF